MRLPTARYPFVDLDGGLEGQRQQQHGAEEKQRGGNECQAQSRPSQAEKPPARRLRFRTLDNAALGCSESSSNPSLLDYSRISGAHLNPAVTIALAIFRDFAWRKVAPYILAQVAGAFLAAALVFWNYLPAFHAADPHLDHTAGVFTTFPAFPEVPSAGLLDQTMGTAILLFMVMALTDARNQPPGANLTPVLVGAVVVAIGMSFGGMHGYAINPARDFGPRLFTVVAGFKNNGLTDGSMVFWVPIVGPILGGIIGAAAYDWGVRRFLPE
jgi:glycerol uptake facilitator protein